MSNKSYVSRVLPIFCFLAVFIYSGFSSTLLTQAQTVAADFGNRSGVTPVIPIGMISVGGTASMPPAAISTMTASTLNQTRVWISIPQIYATPIADFSVLHSELTVMKANGMHGLGVIAGTPPSLGATFCTPPSNMNTWGQMAASVVAYADRYFPGILVDYEIWNEPELPKSICAANATAQLNTYVAMFAAAASRMHAQAKADGQVIRTGGPSTSQLAGKAPIYIPAIANNPATAPYLDFVSFHLYLTGLSNIQNGMTWPQLYAANQVSYGGVQYFYKFIESLVRSGHQPNAATTPIYITEFNDNYTFALDCCRNSLAYGALYNSVTITDMLNAVYSGAKKVPSKLTYFNAEGSYFCIMGQWNTRMDCNTAASDPYPQFYAYRLFASSHYLDLQSGGHMAANVSPQSTTSGLGASAFYTRWADSVVIINPSSTSYPTVAVNLMNPGLTPSSATVYLLNQANFRILTTAASWTAITKGYQVKVAVPPYSTVAVSFK